MNPIRGTCQDKDGMGWDTGREAQVRIRNNKKLQGTDTIEIRKGNKTSPHTPIFAKPSQ